MKTFVKSLNVAIALILIICALGVALLAFPIFGNKALIVRSGSMTPTIDVGSVIIVRQQATYLNKDVIAFRSEKNPNTIITHRIVEIANDNGRMYYKTQGDANNAPDGWQVNPKNVVGKTFLVVPAVGKLLVFARSKIGFPILVITPAVLVILLEIISITGEIRKKRKQKKILLIHPLSFEGLRENYQTVISRKNLGLVKVLIPFFALAIFIQSTSAFFSDTETSKSNFFAAASSFPSTTPSPTPTCTPTPTPSGNSNSCGSSIIISGNGVASINMAYIECIKKKTVNQQNSTTTNTTVNTSSSTGGNQSSGNTGSSSATTTGNASNSVTVTTTSSSNSSN